MTLELGGQLWKLSCDDIVLPQVRRVFGIADEGIQHLTPDVVVHMRMGNPDEIAHWKAFRDQNGMDMDSGILRFRLNDGRAARLSCVSLECDGGGELEWVWLAEPNDIVTRGGSLLLNVWMRRWNADWFPVHGAVIGRGGCYVLVPGASGAGKSTLTASALASIGSAAEWDIIGDDFVWVRGENGRWFAEGPYAGLRLTPAARKMLTQVWPSWSPDGNWTVRGDGKWVGFPERGVQRKGRLVAVMGLVPSEAPGEVLTGLEASALISTFRTSMLLLNASGAKANGYLQACRRLLDSVPLGSLPRSTDLNQNLENIDKWLSNLLLSC